MPTPVIIPTYPVELYTQTATPGPDGYIKHTVLEAQFLFHIADLYGVNLQEILTLNNLTVDSIINPGDILIIKKIEPQDAVAPLTFSKRRIAVTVKKTLESAIANAENNHSLDVDRLVVSKAEVGRAQVMKRFHARGRGRASTVEKWFSHLKIVVAEQQLAVPAEQEAA